MPPPASRRAGAERHIVLPLDLSRFGGSALTATSTYPKAGWGGDPVTYVPARNAIFLTLCLGWARRWARATSSSASTRSIIRLSGLPPDFIHASRDGAARHQGRRRRRADQGAHPLIAMSKAQIAAEAARLGLDAGLSWSCYDPAPGSRHCGLCDACRLRARGFEEAGLPDPTSYAAGP
jgi:7-cyano-7-deazaguanine synthase